MTVCRQGVRSISTAGCMVQSRPRVVSFASAWKAIQSFDQYDMNREPDDVPGNELGRYEIVFKVHEDHYYCFADAVNMDEALGQFFKHHPNITFGMVVDHMEV